MTKHALDELYSHGFYFIPPIIRVFKTHAVKTSKLFRNAILYTTENIAKNKQDCNFNWIPHRKLEKSNNGDKNILFSNLLYIHHDLFIQHLEKFLKEQLIAEENIRTIIFKLQKIYDDRPKNITAENDNKDASNQLPSDSNQNTLEKDSQKEDQITENQEIENQEVETGETIKDDFLDLNDEEKMFFDDYNFNIFF